MTCKCGKPAHHMVPPPGWPMLRKHVLCSGCGISVPSCKCK